MNSDFFGTVKSLVECVKLQQQLIAQVLNFCDGQKADRNPVEQKRREAMAMRGYSARARMIATSETIDKKIAELENALESMAKEEK